MLLNIEHAREGESVNKSRLLLDCYGNLLCF